MVKYDFKLLKILIGLDTVIAVFVEDRPALPSPLVLILQEKPSNGRKVNLPISATRWECAVVFANTVAVA